MKRKMFAPLLTAGAFLMLMPNKLDVSASSGYGGGSGTESDPYLISTPQHLNQLQLDVNVNKIDTTGKYYQLVNDIDLSNYDNDSFLSNGNFTPIGNNSYQFKGTFDGNGKVISNLEIILPNQRYVGLFGYINSAMIRDIGLKDIYISGSSEVGGLVGCQNNGSLTQTYTTGLVVGSGSNGGLVGYQKSGIIEQSYSHVDVDGGVSFYNGGLVGEQETSGSVRESYAIGDVSGNCWGSLIGQSRMMVGGGSNDFRAATNSYWEKVGSETNDFGIGLTTEQMTGENAKDYMMGFDFNHVWRITDDYPELRWQSELTSSTTNTSDLTVNGTIQTMVADVVIPSVSPDLVINPNLPQGFVAPEFSVSNDSVSPIKLELKTFEQTTDTFNDVLPSKYDSWVGLNKQQSRDLALGLIAKEGDGWQTLVAPTSYVSGHTEHEVGIIKPASTVDFSFDVKHGTAFSEAKTVQYKMVFVFDLMN